MSRIFRMFRSPIVLLGVAPAVLAISIGVAALSGGGFVSGQEDTPTATEDATPAPDGTDGPDGTEDGESRVDRYLAALAGNLGITVEELEQALRDTQLQLLDEAVADGLIDEERAAEIRERIKSGEALLFPPFGPPRHAGGWHLKADVAAFLGMTPGELIEARMDGQSLAQIADAQGVGADALAAHLLDQIEEHVSQALENNRITLERADEILANAPERIDEMINSTGVPGPRGRGFGPFGEEAPGGAGLIF